MKNKTRIILAALLALVMVFSVSVLSLAANNGTITIKNENEAVSMAGHTYSAYKIFDVTYTVEGDNKSDYDYTLVEPYKTYFQNRTDLPAGEDLDAQAYNLIANLADDDARQAFAKDLLAVTGAAAAGTTDVITTEGTAQIAVIRNLAPGYYLVYDEGGDPNTQVAAEKVVAALALTTADPDAEIDLKASVPTVEKTITGVSDDATATASANGETEISAQINQHVGFQINSNVPDLTGYTNYIYKVTDVMTEGLTPDKNVKVVIGSTDVTADCQITYTDAERKTVIVIPFSVLHQSTFPADTPITITYSAKVNADASIYPDGTGNGNTATLEYTNNFSDELITDTTPESQVKVYLFSLDITKVNSKNEPLAGAQFVLKDAAGKCVPVALDSNTGRYKVSATLEANDENATVTSDADGKIYVDGIAAGDYTLTETVAPEGYNKLKKDVEINVTATYKDDGTVDEVDGNVISVVNRSGSLLPTTGGIGTYLFTFGGAALMIAAIAFLVIRKKKETAK